MIMMSSRKDYFVHQGRAYKLIKASDDIWKNICKMCHLTDECKNIKVDISCGGGFMKLLNSGVNNISKKFKRQTRSRRYCFKYLKRSKVTIRHEHNTYVRENVNI